MVSPSQKRLDILAIGLPTLVYFAVLKAHQYLSFGIHGELADFEYILWSSLHGNLLAVDAAGSSFLSQHISPILLGLVPLYALFQSPWLLLTVQAAAAALAVIPLYLLALHCLSSRTSASAITLAYVLSRVLSYGLMYDFHMEIFYPPLLFCAFLAVEHGRWGWFFPFLLLTLAVKEDAGIACLGLGLYLIVSGRKRSGAATVAISAAWLALAFLVFFPHFRQGLRGDAYQFASYWSGYGASVSEIVKNMFDPGHHASILFAAEKPGKMFNLFSVFLFLPLLDWRTALFLVLPTWFVLYSSSHPLLYGPLIYYGLLITPFLFYSTILVLRGIGRGRLPHSSRWVVVLAILVLLVNLGNSRIFKHARADYWRIDPRFRIAQRLIDGLPPDAAVAAQVDLQSHVPVRPDRLLIPNEIDRAEYLLFDLDGNSWPLTREENRVLADSLRGSAQWELVSSEDAFLLLRRSEAPGE